MRSAAAKPPAPDYVVERGDTRPVMIDWPRVLTFGVLATSGIAFWYWAFTSLTAWIVG